ncbi:hypothetical protein [Aliihoeflea sp. 40Bstr573]|uniref:hypothetical protein n=1 Tax=Aliihoeflea sp. 40Bstr573 TaxID=2696467 RepID=UPI0020958AE2|nr:hypothetical protein [Aliihoeflea sp. 40Bstr573]MCO6387125.1 hypothetical protein [Aliihoeflea sp. 40Bstr573]
MADFVAVLKKTIDGLKDNSPQMREKVYDKARATIEAKLAALNPPPPAGVVERQRQALETAIVQVREEYAAPPPPAADPDFEQDFSNFFGEAQDEARVQAHEEPAGYADEPYQPVPSRPADEIYDEPVAGDAHSGGAGDAGYDDDYAERPYSDAYSDDAQWQDDAQRDVFLDEGHADRPALHSQEYEDDAAAGQPLYAPRVPSRKKRRSATGLIAALLVLVVVAGAGYGIWLNRDDFASMFGSAPQEVATEPAEPTEGEDVASAPAETAAPDEAEAPVPETEKFTQRLLPDGTEVDEGVAGEEPTIGEGTSVAAVTPPGEAQGATAAPATGDDQANDQPQLAVGQRAIFYEERTADAEGSAESGTILWSLVQESPGGDLPPEAAIRAEVTIPARDLQLRMTIRRNGDQSLPASHIIEMIFLTPDNFAGGTIDNVLRVAMKDTEQAAGNPLIGIPAKIADGFFLVALSDSSAEVEANTTLMRRQNWIDIPITYGSGRRALMTMEKGIPGDRVFQEALRAWAELAPIAEKGEGQAQ